MTREPDAIEINRESQKHTPGPWTVGRQDDGVVMVDAASGAAICDVYGGGDGASDANARLIAAAPDLLKACEDGNLDWYADRLVRVYGESENVDFVLALRRRAAMARAAIKKARQ